MPFLSQKQRLARKNKKHNLIFQRQKFFKFFAQAKLYQILQKKSTPFKLLLMLLNIGKTPLIFVNIQPQNLVLNLLNYYFYIPNNF